MSATIDVVFAVWILWALLFGLRLCSAAARPIPYPEPLPIGPTAIVQVMRQRCPSVNCALVSLSLFAFLLVGCATRRDYPDPVHGLTFNGTIQSIDLKEHRLAVAPLKPGEPVVFLWEDSTRFWKNGDPIRTRIARTHLAGARSLSHDFRPTDNPSCLCPDGLPSSPLKNRLSHALHARI